MTVLPENIISGMAVRLQKIYGNNFSESFLNRILRLLLDHKKGSDFKRDRWSEKDVILITYGNSITEKGEFPLVTLNKFLTAHLREEISGVHILPFFPYSSDYGFSVIDYYKVNSELGDWKHVEKIGENFDLMIDLVINHVSQYHIWFQNFLKQQHPGENYFIEDDPSSDHSKVVRPRSSPLLTAFDTFSGKKYVWTTFSNDQIDLNFKNPEVLLEMIRVLLFYISKGAGIIRLDAIAFLWKKQGTNCLHLPETHEIVKLFRDIVQCVSPEVILLTETNVPHNENISYFGKGDEANMVYQFGLPPLILHALYTENADYLTNWAFTIPETRKGNTFFNFTASHDGIGVRPLEGILPQNELNALLKGMEKNGGLVSYKSNSDGTESPYEINITYFDALKSIHSGTDKNRIKRFLCSQTIMAGLKGIPAFYIHSFLATANDYEGYEKTGSARAINRRQITFQEITEILNGENDTSFVFSELCRIIRLRKKQKPFHPDAEMKMMNLGNKFFAFIRTWQDEKIVSVSNISGQEQVVALPEKILSGKFFDLISNTAYHNRLKLLPYQTLWLMNT